MTFIGHAHKTQTGPSLWLLQVAPPGHCTSAPPTRACASVCTLPAPPAAPLDSMRSRPPWDTWQTPSPVLGRDATAAPRLCPPTTTQILKKDSSKQSLFTNILNYYIYFLIFITK